MTNKEMSTGEMIGAISKHIEQNTKPTKEEMQNWHDGIVYAAAQLDPDNPPLTPEQLVGMRRRPTPDRKIDPDDDVMTLAVWNNAIANGLFNEYDGSGCWLKDGKFMTDKVFDNVFERPPEGATHVVWYNK